MVFPVPVELVGRLYLRGLVKVFEVEVMVAASMMIVRQEPSRLEVNLVFWDYSQVVPEHVVLQCHIAVNASTAALGDHLQGLEEVVHCRVHIPVP